MKIALVSDDGITISQHFGRASFYVVVAVENGQVVSREMREKPGHAQFAGQHGHEAHEHPAGQGHGFDAAAQDRHSRMAAAIADCEVLIARGMGAGAYHSLQQAGIRPIITDIPTVDEAVRAFIEGRLIDHPERLH